MVTSTIEKPFFQAEKVQLSPYEQFIWEGMSAALSGNWRARMKMTEQALSTSDFPAAFQKVNNAVLRAKLAEYAPTWTTVAKRLVAQNLRPQKEMEFNVDNTNLPDSNAGTTRLPASLPRVPELTQYPTINFTASGAEFSTAKNGARVAFSWEAWLNDDWGQIANFPDQLRELATNTMETEAWSQFINKTGFNVAMFPAGNNLVGNAALTLQSLSAAIVQAGTNPVTPADRTPLRNDTDRWALLVPRNLELTANAIINATNIKYTDANGTVYDTQNTVSGKVQVVPMAWWGILAPSASYAATGWALVPLNGEGLYGTTAANVFLAGQEVPELRIKNDQGNALGGGALSPYDGSFDIDDIQIRLRFFCAGRTLSNYGTVWSKGTGVGSTNPAV